MSEQPVVYAVPTHLTTREPFVFGRSLDEFAKLIAVACVALKLAFSDGIPVPVRLPLVGLVIVVGIAWALLRVQRYSLDSWLGLAFRFGASPRRRVWRPTSMQVANQPDQAAETLEHGAGWQNLEHIRVRWAEQRSVPQVRINGALMSDVSLIPKRVHAPSHARDRNSEVLVENGRLGFDVSQILINRWMQLKTTSLELLQALYDSLDELAWR